MIALLNRVAFNLRLWTLLLPVIAFLVAGSLSLTRPNATAIDPVPYFGLLVFTTVVWSIAVENYGLGTAEHVLRDGGRAYTTLLATLFTIFAELLFMFFYRPITFSRFFVSVNGVALLISALGLRYLLRIAPAKRVLSGAQSIRILIVGADDFAQATAKSLAERGLKTIEVSGFVRLPGQEVTVDGLVYEMDEVAEVVVRNRLDDVIIAICSSRLQELPVLMARLRQFGVPLRLALDLGERHPTSHRLLNINGVWMVNLCHTPAESVMYLFLKRAFDISFSLLALIVASPLMLVVAAAIKLTSPGPIFFKQDRVGFSGALFKMYKFRTMKAASTTESDTRWTKPHDSRCTPIGTFLRKTSLDELPQFLNVLAGDMSVVGPRPERPYFVQKFAAEMPRYHARHYLKVGITGWAQVNGWRGDTSIEKRIEHDLYYLNNWTLLFDLRIVLLTIVRTLAAKHAY